MNRWPGLLVAGVTALVSGISVFVNSYGVRAVPDAAVYTTAKNLVAAVLLCAGAGVAGAFRRRSSAASLPGHLNRVEPPLGPGAPARWLGLAYVGVVGGGVAFILFFEGLAHTSAEPAAFLHGTLVIWVAVLAPPILGERLSLWNVAAILLLVGGQIVVAGGVGQLVAGQAQVLILAATMLWAVETVVAKLLLRRLSPTTLAVVRMGVGALVLTAFVVLDGKGRELVDLGTSQAGWVLVTGTLLALYVGTWMVALSRARALDVTSVLVASVVVTLLLQVAAGHSLSGSEVVGVVLVAAGIAAILVAWPRARTRTAGSEVLARHSTAP